jgi:hypothetical protein
VHASDSATYQTGGGSRLCAINGRQESADLANLKLVSDVWVSCLTRFLKFHIRPRVFETQLVSVGMMTSHLDLSVNAYESTPFT